MLQLPCKVHEAGLLMEVFPGTNDFFNFGIKNLYHTEHLPKMSCGYRSHGASVDYTCVRNWVLRI